MELRLCFARLVKGIPNMASDDRIPRPGGESRARQIASAVAEPGDIPARFALRHADDGCANTQFGYLEGHGCVGVGFGGGLMGEQRDASMREAGIGQERGRRERCSGDAEGGADVVPIIKRIACCIGNGRCSTNQ